MKEVSEHWLKAAEDDLHVVAMIASEDHLGLLPTGKPTLAEAKQFYECARSIHDQVMAKL
jgi:hypothetical protein